MVLCPTICYSSVHAPLRSRPEIAPLNLDGENVLLINNSTTHCPIALKFDILVHYGPPNAAKFWRSACDQIQDGGRPLNSQLLNRSNSAADWSISLTFGMWMHCGCAEVTQGLKSTYREIQGAGRPKILNCYNSALHWVHCVCKDRAVIEIHLLWKGRWGHLQIFNI